MSLALFTIGFGRPELLHHQKRLLDKYLDEDFGLCLIDNTPGIMRNHMEIECKKSGIGYLHTPEGKSEHNDGLNFAVEQIEKTEHEYFGFLDADIFPRKHTTMIDKIKKAGFYGWPQTHIHTGYRYLWPGLCFFSRKWLNGRKPNFDGIRCEDSSNDGDCGSMLHSLFTFQDWLDAPLISCTYGSIRAPMSSNENIQSWGYEVIGDWIHMMNSSHWLRVPSAGERDRLLLQMIECL